MITPSEDERFDRKNPGSRSAEISTGNDAILECVEKGLLDTLGGSAEEATLYFLEVRGGLKRSGIPGDPEGFTYSLRAIFGSGSAELLKAILGELRLKEAKQPRDKPLHDFAKVVEQAIKSVESGIL